MSGDQMLQAIQLIFNGLTAIVNIILTTWVAVRVGTLKQHTTTSASEIRNDIAMNTAKTEHVTQAINGNLDARIATATQAALERGRLEGKAEALESERQRREHAAFAALAVVKKEPLK